MKIVSAIAVVAVFTGLSLGLSVPLAYGHGGDTDLVHSCVNNTSGTIRLVGPNDTCRTGETPLDWAKAERKTAAIFTVDCDAGQTIQDALENLVPGDTLLVTGTCNENVTIREEIDRITLDGQGTAVINGSNSARDTVQIRGRGITLKGFEITGGNSGINVRGGSATIDGNLIHNTGQHGVGLANGSSATIVNNTIQDNPGIGSGIGSE